MGQIILTMELGTRHSVAQSRFTREWLLQRYFAHRGRDRPTRVNSRFASRCAQHRG